MKTIYKQYGVTASITDKRDGTARLVVRDAFSQKVRDSIHKNRKAAGIGCAGKRSRGGTTTLVAPSFKGDESFEVLSEL